MYDMQSMQDRYSAVRMQVEDDPSEGEDLSRDDQSSWSDSGCGTPNSRGNLSNIATPKNFVNHEPRKQEHRRSTLVNKRDIPKDIERLIAPKPSMRNLVSRTKKKSSLGVLSVKQSISSNRQNVHQELEQISSYNEFSLSRKNGKTDDIPDSVSAYNFRKSNPSENKKQDEMTTTGQFILLFSANIFLSGDFEYCLKITSNDFTSIENNALFEANILRFRSLAADQVYNHKSFEDKNDSEQQYCLKNFFLAFKAAVNALKIYDSDIGNDQKSNHHGQALQEFQIGYLYERSIDTLLSQQTLDYIKSEKEADLYKYKINSKVEVIKRALDHYTNA